MTSKTEKLANNYVWKSEYSKEYKEGYNKIDWTQPAKRQTEWDEIRQNNGRITYRLKTSKQE